MKKPVLEEHPFFHKTQRDHKVHELPCYILLGARQDPYCSEISAETLNSVAELKYKTNHTVSCNNCILVEMQI